MSMSNPLIRPAERLLRRLRLGGKLTVLALAALWPLATMVALAALVPAWPLWPVALAGGAMLVYLMVAFHVAFVGEFQRVLDVMSQTASGNLRAQIRTELTSPTVLHELTTENGGIVLNAVPGGVDLYIADTDTATFTWEAAVYDLEVVLSNGDVRRLLAGPVTVSPEVTR